MCVFSEPVYDSSSNMTAHIGHCRPNTGAMAGATATVTAPAAAEALPDAEEEEEKGQKDSRVTIKPPTAHKRKREGEEEEVSNKDKTAAPKRKGPRVRMTFRVRKLTPPPPPPPPVPIGVPDSKSKSSTTSSSSSSSVAPTVLPDTTLRPLILEWYCDNRGQLTPKRLATPSEDLENSLRSFVQRELRIENETLRVNVKCWDWLSKIHKALDAGVSLDVAVAIACARDRVRNNRSILCPNGCTATFSSVESRDFHLRFKLCRKAR